MDQNSLIPKKDKVSGGNVHSKVVPNGYGKSEFLIEETVVDQDSRELRFQLEDKSVVQLNKILRMDNGMKLDVPSQLEVTRSSLRPLRMNIFQSQELKFTLLHAQVMDVEVLHQ